MQQFTVPQFIDVEDKIFGPITTRQFVLLIVGGLILFILFKLLSTRYFVYFVISAIVDVGVTALFAFFRVNGMPFHYFILNIIQTFRKPKLRVWDKSLTDAEVSAILKRETESVVAGEDPVPLKRPLGSSSLSEIALIVDTGGEYRGEGILNQKAPPS
ncbi:MAG: PrgI family protein [Parcubacteria group bacterium]|nr:PrgI family protein [Parcubacteria group bacterium]